MPCNQIQFQPGLSLTDFLMLEREQNTVLGGIEIDDTYLGGEKPSNPSTFCCSSSNRNDSSQLKWGPAGTPFGQR